MGDFAGFVGSARLKVMYLQKMNFYHQSNNQISLSTLCHENNLRVFIVVKEMIIDCCCRTKIICEKKNKRLVLQLWNMVQKIISILIFFLLLNSSAHVWVRWVWLSVSPGKLYEGQQSSEIIQHTKIIPVTIKLVLSTQMFKFSSVKLFCNLHSN